MFKLDFWKKKNRPARDEDGEMWGQGYGYPDTTRSSLFAGEDDWDVTASKPVFSSRPDGRARTYEDFIRARMNTHQRYGDSGGGGGAYYDRYSDRFGYRRAPFEEEEEGGGLSANRMMQLLGAGVLVAAVYFTFQSSTPTAQRVQAFVHQKMGEDTNIQAVTAWWQDKMGDRGAAVPAMSTGTGSGTGAGTSQDTAADAKSLKFALPVIGTVKTPFDGTAQQGVTIKAEQGAEIKAAAKGMIESVEKEGLEDYTVTINHGTAGKTIYRHLVTVNVAANDWVEPSQTIGILTKKGEAELFFAYERDGAFVNPADILTMPAGR